MNREELQKVHDALSLLNSMVNCGDQHSSTSVNMTQAAFAILRNPLPPRPADGREDGRCEDVSKLAYKVMLRRCGAINNADGTYTMQEADIKAWFENGDHLKQYTEYDLL